jgi:hypothetical protein
MSAGVYSFLDVQASISGPGGSFALESAGVSDEAIRVAMDGPKNTKTMGANGDGMHSLHASKGGKITVSLLKTAPGNAQMNQLYNFQQTSAANWGQNTITVKNPVTGDSVTAVAGAFVKQSDLGYSTDGNLNTWEFDFVQIDEVLGNGLNPTGLVIAA